MFAASDPPNSTPCAASCEFRNWRRRLRDDCLKHAEHERSHYEREHRANPNADRQRLKLATPLWPVDDGVARGTQRSKMTDSPPHRGAAENGDQVVARPRDGWYARERQQWQTEIQKHEPDHAQKRPGKNDQHRSDDRQTRRQPHRDKSAALAHEQALGDNAVRNYEWSAS